MSSKMEEAKINNLDSDTSLITEPVQSKAPGWLRLGFVTAASLFAGGLAVAWWYKKTLTRLHESGENGENTQFGISDNRQSTEDED